MKPMWIQRLCASKRGFSLIELSALLIVIALAISTTLSMRSGKVDRDARVSSKSNVTEIVEALEAYANRNGRLPCVASRTLTSANANFGREVLADCVADTSTPAGTLRYETSGGSGVYVREGAVPVYDLLLPDSYMYDEYGNRYTYAVIEGLTATSSWDAATGVLTVKDGADADVTTAGAYVVFSHGRDGKGSYRGGSGALKVACGATTNLDVENCDGDVTFRSADFSETQTAALFYDDLFAWGDKPTVGGGGGGSPDFTGFKIAAETGYCARGVATGDINGDGFEDVIMGCDGYGYTYVVFGSADGITTSFNVTALNGTNGFRIDETTSGYWFGVDVASGDINNDGFDDIIIGAHGANSNAGYAYVVFGKASGWTASILASSLNGTTGFRLDGAGSNHYSGYAVSSGDVNNDGFDDVIVGAYGANSQAGYTYVVFGKASGWASTIALSGLDGTTGFRLDGTNANDYSGYAVSSGDINNDGFEDIIVGAVWANTMTGYTYVVFGKASGWASTIALSGLDGTIGFRLDGAAMFHYSGFAVDGCDVNNDGFGDIITGAYYANSQAGYTYVVFGKANGWASTVALSGLNGTTGFRLDGTNANDRTGLSVGCGDINNDGFDDVFVGTYYINTSTGSAYVVFGKGSGWASTIALNSLNGTTGFKLDGTNTSDQTSWSMASGDITGDGIKEILVSSARGLGGVGVSSVYGIYGSCRNWDATNNLDTLINTAYDAGGC